MIIHKEMVAVEELFTYVTLQEKKGRLTKEQKNRNARLNEDVIYVNDDKEQGILFKRFGEDLVNLTSQRLVLFKEKGTQCICCGLEANIFQVDFDTQCNQAHLNLYFYDGETRILFTKDHIKPKSRKGGDDHSNYATMCAHCNEAKKNNELEGEELQASVLKELNKRVKRNRDILKGLELVQQRLQNKLKDKIIEDINNSESDIKIASESLLKNKLEVEV